MLPKGGDKVVSPKGITVNIDKDMNFLLNKVQVKIEDLPSRIQEAVKGKSDADKVIILAADETVPIGEVVRIMNIGKKMNIKVLLATQKETNGGTK